MIDVEGVAEAEDEPEGEQAEGAVGHVGAYVPARSTPICTRAWATIRDGQRGKENSSAARAPKRSPAAI